MATRDLTGRQFGRWTAIERVGQSGAAKWRCRCSCGTERVVAAKNLIAGTSTSCGCNTRERVRDARRADLTGRRFGKLTVLEEAQRRADGARQWRCRCDCGRECLALHHSLQTGKRTGCGCRNGRQSAQDVTGQRFAMLTALYPTQERGRNGSVIWHCRCECGNEIDISLDRLKYSDVISCGCMRERCNQEISDKLIHVAGTSIDAIRSSRPRSDSSTGVKGVSVKRGRFCATITFQQRRYYLGSYATLDAARQARREAEAALYGSTVDFYERWKRRAEGDPAWAERNPIDIRVRVNQAGTFQLEMLPALDEPETELANGED